jgi:hypothetical protein
LTYVLTFRDDGRIERRLNLAAVLGWVSTLPDVRALVIEQAARPSPTFNRPENVDWVFCPNPGPFNKGWGLNVGARVSRSPWLAFGDADVVCADGWLQAVRQLRHSATPIVKPYRQIVDLTPEESAAVRAGDWHLRPRRSAGALPNREAQGEYVVFAGGLFLLHRDVFEQVGGFDERFLGWGGEDDAMTLRLMASGFPLVEVGNTPALHLWHPRSAETTVAQPHYAANLALLADYRRSTVRQLRHLGQAQREGMGRPEKYAPPTPSQEPKASARVSEPGAPMPTRCAPAA